MSDLENDGFLWLRRAFNPGAIRAFVWDQLNSQFGIAQGDRSTWREDARPLLSRFELPDLFAGVLSDVVRSEIARHLGPEWHGFRKWGVLVTFPGPGKWTVPARGWHLDSPAFDGSPLPALRLFAFLNDVAPGGGGTCVVAGSHRVGRAVTIRAGRSTTSSTELRKMLIHSHDWFEELMTARPPYEPTSRNAMLLEDGTDVDGVPVRVVELVGDAGDVVLWHPALLHAASPNCSNQPRFMLTYKVMRGKRRLD